MGYGGPETARTGGTETWESDGRYSPKLKFQVVLEVLSGDKTPGQVAKAYGVHANTVGIWKRQFLDKGPEIFAEDSSV